MTAAVVRPQRGWHTPGVDRGVFSCLEDGVEQNSPGNCPGGRDPFFSAGGVRSWKEEVGS